MEEVTQMLPSQPQENVTWLVGRVGWLVLLVASFAIYLAVSSVLANAVHSLAKTNFGVKPFGSISAWGLATATLWPAFIAYLVITLRWVRLNRLILDMSLVALWMLCLTALTAFSDEFLGHLGIFAGIVWLLEIGIPASILYVLRPPLSVGAGLQGPSVAILSALAWLTEAKALLLWLSPGFGIRT